jgi:glycosyltransferase involved in cell wall biosynthesis
VSEELRSLFGRATTPELAERATVAPCAIELGSAPTREAARRLFGIDGSERLAVVVGRLVPTKRPEIAVAWALDARADRVIVVGDGPLLDELRARFPRAEFTGRRGRAETLAWIAAADLLVSASLHEGAPTAVREARALGVPVLAAPSGDLVDWAARDAGITLARA